MTSLSRSIWRQRFVSLSGRGRWTEQRAGQRKGQVAIVIHLTGCADPFYVALDMGV